MKATLLYRQKETKGSYIREIVIWKLDRPLAGCNHLFKYRLYYGRIDGTCFVRYDNERGKGDHRHIDTGEVSYRFTDLEGLLKDFAADIAAVSAEVEEFP